MAGNWKMHFKSLRWRAWCLNVRAWRGQKVTMLKNHWFLYVFLKGQEGPQESKNVAGKWKMHPKDLRWRVWCLCVRAWWGRKVNILRIRWLRSVLSGPVNSKPTFLRRILLLQRGPRYDEKGNRRDKGAIGVKKGPQKRVYPTLFDVEKVWFLV